MTAKNKPVENKDLIMDIRQKIEERESLQSRTHFIWVKGHANDQGNSAADRLAVEGAMMGRGIDGEVEAVEELEQVVPTEETIGLGYENLEVEDAFRAMESAMNGD
jgi:ribonuclease HI